MVTKGNRASAKFGTNGVALGTNADARVGTEGRCMTDHAVTNKLFFIHKNLR